MEDVKRIIDNWEVRVFIIMSTFLQICLIIWMYQRKRSSYQPVRRIIWLAAYTAADFTATLSLGGIFHVNMNPNASQNSAKNKYLLALWAPFILLHLGGQSKMTAFSLADNEFWLSHVFRFVYHELTALFICILAFTDRHIRYPSSILFIIGTIKFGERIWALKRGSMNELRSSTFKEVDPGLNKQEVSQIESSYIKPANKKGELEFGDADRGIHIGQDAQQQVHSHNNDVKTLCAAYQSFSIYKGLYVDATFSSGDIIGEGQRFSNLDIVEALYLMDMELSFAHDLFYTKTVLSHTLWGWIVRFVSLISISSAMGLFVVIDKHGFQQLDVGIAYILLITAFILEVLSFLESLTANQTIVQVGFKPERRWRFVEGIIRDLRRVISTRRGILFPIQLNRIGQFSLLSYCFHDSKSRLWSKGLLEFLELKELWDTYHYTRYVPVDDVVERKDRIFDRVGVRVEEEQSQGNNSIFLALVSQSVSTQMAGSEILEANLNTEYEECLLIWHIATDLCYRNVVAPSIHLQDAKFLSEYMIYLLVLHPSMVSSLTTTELTSYRKACASSIQLFSDYKMQNDRKVYEELLNIHNILERNPRTGGNSLLQDAFKVAMTLENRQLANGAEDRWELLFHLWVDILSYAAWHCKGKCHAEQLGTGGQLLTYVWLFMVHLIRDSCHQIDIENGGGQ